MINDPLYQFYNPTPKWEVEIMAIQTVIRTPNECSWWFRFWCTFFFGAKWTKL